MFDGTPAQLTTGVARDIYGADETFNEFATSTKISGAEAVAEKRVKHPAIQGLM